MLESMECAVRRADCLGLCDVHYRNVRASEWSANEDSWKGCTFERLGLLSVEEGKDSPGLHVAGCTSCSD
jgi:hypothetical protein